MKFIYIYILGLALLFALSCVALYYSFKKHKSNNRAAYLYLKTHKKDKRVKKQYGKEWFRDWFADFSSEIVGAFITTLIFGLLVTVAQSSQQENSDKTRLIIQLGSESHNITLAASEELLSRGWLRDGTLKGAILTGANLQGLFLKSADFEGASMNWANMKGVSLIHANLANADFFAADLCGALLAEANLQNSRMTSADLRKADFYGANLKNTSLIQADLRGAMFWFASFDEDTVLPDGSHLDLSADIMEQLDRFTNSKNPNFVPFFDFTDLYKSLENPDCIKYRPADLPR